MKTCELCKKGSRMVGNRILLRGHYNPTNWTRKYPNLQKATSPEGKKVLACTQCIKTFTKADRVAENKAKRTEAKRMADEKRQSAVEINRAKQKKAAEAKKARSASSGQVKVTGKETKSKKATK